MEFPSQKKHQCQAPPQGWALNAFTLTNSGSPFQTMTTPTQHECRSVVSDYLQPHGLHSSCNSPGRNSGMCSLSLLQGIFPTQGSNPGLLHCSQILYQLSHKGRPRILEWVAYPFSSRSSRPRSQTGVSCIAGRFFTN